MIMSSSDVCDVSVFFSFKAVIMTPTRELALQITKECKKFSKSLGLRVVCVYGGTGISEQVHTPSLFLVKQHLNISLTEGNSAACLFFVMRRLPS